MANRDAARTTALPFIVWVVIVCTAIAVITTGITILGRPLLAYAWLVPLVIALFDLVAVPGRIRFPILLWSPWIALVLWYVVDAETEHAFQRSIMMLAPLVVGMATSKHVLPVEGLPAFRRGYVFLTLGLLTGAVLKTGFSLRGLPDSSPLAPEVMTGALLAGLFAASYAHGRKRDLLWWAVLAFLPVIGLTRMGIIATAVTLPLSLAPLGLRRRIALTALLVIAAVAVFETPRFQRKMFISGRGDLTDLTMDNPNVFLSGRRRVWDYLESRISEQPWFGHGANASEPIVNWLTHGGVHPHNDWLRVRYEYGNFGAVVFGACMAAQLLHLWRRGKRLPADRQLLAFAGASSFLSFSLFMLTDNIILYASYFGNLQFAIIGMAYSPEPDAPAEPIPG